MSEATASRYRSIASKTEWMEMKHSFKKVQLDIQADRDAPAVKAYLGTGLVFRNGRYYLQEPTLVRSKMIRKRLPVLHWKKMKALEKGILKGKINGKP